MSTPVHEFALYHLDNDGSCTCAGCPEPFSAAAYSRYKYGCPDATGRFAGLLSAAFLAHRPGLAHRGRLLVASSPYHRVPTAAAALARRFRTLLNNVRAGRGLAPAVGVHIERMTTTSGDYGTLGSAQRRRLMAGNRLSFRAVLPHAGAGAHLIVIDDVRITGAHQGFLRHASAGLALGSRTFVHLAALRHGPREVLDPALEDALNHAAVRTLDDLAPLATAAGFAWNVRICKFLLDVRNRDQLPGFLAGMPDGVVRALRAASLADGYATMPAYRAGHALVDDELERRRGRGRGDRPGPATAAGARRGGCTGRAGA
jgi:hypothetical protein